MVYGVGFMVEGQPERAGADVATLVFKAHRLLYHSTLGLRVIKKNLKGPGRTLPPARRTAQTCFGDSGQLTSTCQLTNK